MSLFLFIFLIIFVICQNNSAVWPYFGFVTVYFSLQVAVVKIETFFTILFNRLGVKIGLKGTKIALRKEKNLNEMDFQKAVLRVFFFCFLIIYIFIFYYLCAIHYFPHRMTLPVIQSCLSLFTTMYLL